MSGTPVLHPLPRPTLVAVISAAVDATGATAGWVLEAAGAGFVVACAAGGAAGWAASLVGRRTGTAAGTASLVVQSAQPVALLPGSTSLRDELGTELLGRSPVSLVCVPCVHTDTVAGALQLVDKAGGGPFDFDDVELATLLGTVAGAALHEGRAGIGAAGALEWHPRGPGGLGHDLARLAEVDPRRYAVAAAVVEALLPGGQQREA